MTGFLAGQVYIRSHTFVTDPEECAILYLNNTNIDVETDDARQVIVETKGISPSTLLHLQALGVVRCPSDSRDIYSFTFSLLRFSFIM